MSTPTRLALRLYQVLWAGIDWVYPPICAGCGKSGIRWCEKCSASVTLVEPPVCDICGDFQPHDQVCQQCSKQLPKFTALRSWAIFDGSLREAIHRFKYERDLSLGELFARPMIELVYKMNWKIDLVVPVPLSKRRYNERGYNQSAFLARPIALGINVPYSSRSLRRIRDTRTQIGLDADERRDNVAHAFEAEAGRVMKKNILVVDDVTTTGSTINACSSALIQAGAKNVYGLTLARAILT